MKQKASMTTPSKHLLSTEALKQRTSPTVRHPHSSIFSLPRIPPEDACRSPGVAALRPERHISSQTSIKSISASQPVEAVARVLHVTLKRIRQNSSLQLNSRITQPRRATRRMKRALLEVKGARVVKSANNNCRKPSVPCKY